MLNLVIYLEKFTAWKVSKYGVFSVPYFPAFGLNTERYVSLRIQSECGKMRTRITPNTDTFQAVDILAKQCFRKNFSTLPIIAFHKIPEWTKLMVEKNITKNTSELKKMMQESVLHVLRYLPTRILPLQNSRFYTFNTRLIHVFHCHLNLRIDFS